MSTTETFGDGCSKLLGLHANAKQYDAVRMRNHNKNDRHKL